MKRAMMMVLLAALSMMAGVAAAQDSAGMGIGGFFETRIDNEVAGEDLAFDYYGVRLQFRDERWFNVFADLGMQSADWGDYESDASGFFGLGGTLWLVRGEDLVVPIDLGLYASFYSGDLDIDSRGAASYDATYTKFVGQGVLRATDYGIAVPFLRVGVMKSELDVSGLSSDDDWDVTNPAINAGVEITPQENFTVTLEGNYSESVGFGIRGDLWF